MKETLESFSTSKILEKAIQNNMEHKDFRLLKAVLQSLPGAEERQATLSSLSGAMSQAAFHKLVNGLVQLDPDFPTQAPKHTNIAGIALSVEAALNNPNKGEIDSTNPKEMSLEDIHNSVNIALSHYPKETINKQLISAMIPHIIQSLNPYNYIESTTLKEIRRGAYENAMPGDQPKQEDIDQLTLEESQHEAKIKNLITQLQDSYTSDQHLANIKNNDHSIKLDENTKEIHHNVIPLLISKTSLPRTVHDPLDQKALTLVEETIIPGLENLAKTGKKKGIRDNDIENFVEKVSTKLKELDIKDIDKEGMSKSLKTVYVDVTTASPIPTKDKALYSIGKHLKQSNISLFQKIGNYCHTKIAQASMKALDNNQDLAKDALAMVESKLKDQANVIGNHIKSYIAGKDSAQQQLPKPNDVSKTVKVR